MKTQKILSMLEHQRRQLNQVNSLSNMLANVGRLSTHSDNDLRGCMSILFDLSDDIKASHEIITQSFIQLGIVNDCVNDNSGR
jgi:conjugal transfer/entry exclusion protein